MHGLSGECVTLQAFAEDLLLAVGGGTQTGLLGYGRQGGLCAASLLRVSYTSSHLTLTRIVHMLVEAPFYR